jgi:hypothetical protein
VNGSYLSLQLTDEKLFQRFPGLVAVPNVFESLCCVLAANVQHHLFTAAAIKNHESARESVRGTTVRTAMIADN